MTEEKSFGSRINLNSLNEKVTKAKSEIGIKLVGQKDLVDLILAGILSDGHLLIEGVPGVAKTYAAKLLARVVGASFSRIQFTPDLMPSDVTGTSIFNAKDQEFEFKPGPIFSNVILIDEINRAPAKTQAALFECMEERQVTVDGQTYAMDFPFIVLATQNPVEHEGTYKLPEAQLDRFLFKIEVTYPTPEEEIAILNGVSSQVINNNFDNLKVVFEKEDISQFRSLVQEIRVEDKLITYIAKITDNTRSHPGLFLGASPRASIGILNASKAIAAIAGRDFVTPDDIRKVTYPVLNHRVILVPEKEMEGLKPSDIIKEIIEQIEIPR